MGTTGVGTTPPAAERDITSLARRAADLGVSIEVQLPDGTRRTLSGETLQRYVANGSLVQSELRFDVQDFQSVVTRAVAQAEEARAGNPNAPPLRVRLDRSVANVTLFDGVDGNVSNATLDRIAHRAARRSGLAAPGGLRLGRREARTAGQPPELAGVPMLLRTPGSSAPVTTGSFSEARWRDRAAAILMMGGPELRAQISPPVSRAVAEQRLRDMLERTAPPGVEAALIRRLATLIYDESFAVWGNAPPTPGAAEVEAERETIIAGFLMNMPADADTVIAASRLLEHPLLAAAPAEILQARLDQIAAGGYRPADMDQFRRDLTRGAAAAHIEQVENGPRPEVRPRLTFSREARSISRGVITGGETREFALTASTFEGETRSALLGWVEDPSLAMRMAAFNAEVPSEPRARQLFARRVCDRRIRPEDFRRVREECEGLAALDTDWSRSFFAYLTIDLGQDHFDRLFQAAVRAEEAQRRVKQALARQRDEATAAHQYDQAAAEQAQSVEALQRLLAELSPPPGT